MFSRKVRFTKSRLFSAVVVLGFPATGTFTGEAFAQCQVAELTASDGSAGDRFPVPVCLSGGVAILGAGLDDCAAGPDCGSAYIFREMSGHWVQEAKLTASDAVAGARFGWSVAISGNVAVVGAYVSDAVYVYRFNGSTWVQEAKLTGPGGRFGWSVAADGNVAVVGAYYANSAYFYRFDGTSWVQEAVVSVPSFYFGHWVAVDGDVAVIGAVFESCAAGAHCGAAYVYRFNGTTWIQEQRLAASQPAAEDNFGYSVAISGSAALIGSHGDNCNPGVDCGAAYVYRFDGATWLEEAKLTASDRAAGDGFGLPVSIYADAVLVGASGKDCSAGADCGAAYLFRRTGPTWGETAKIIPSDVAANDQFGASLSLSGDTAIIGSYGDDYGGPDFGSACVFDVTCGADSDGDGVPDATDNCPFVINSDQLNSDADSHGDACDNCPLVANEDQADSNGDRIGDACDPCPITGDCDCAPGCPRSLIGNGACNPPCYNASCDWDGSDCPLSCEWNVIYTLRDKLEQLIRTTLAEHYQEGTKYLVYFGGDIKGVAGVGATVFIDLNDFLAITPEGEDGWVTMWLEIRGSLGVGAKVRLGIVPKTFSCYDEDPFLLDFGCDIGSVTFGAFSAKIATVESTGTDSCVADLEVTPGVGVDVISCGLPLPRFEVKRSDLEPLLLEVGHDSFIALRDGNDPTAALVEALLPALVKSSPLGLWEPSLPVRPATRTDTNSDAQCARTLRQGGPCGIGVVGMLPLMLLTLIGVKFAHGPRRAHRGD